MNKIAKIFGVVLFASFVNSVPVYALDGPTRGLNKKLIYKLKTIERVFGAKVHVTPNGGCRKHGNRMAPKSYHRIAAGCKAADIVVKGVSPRRLYQWCLRHNHGGCGYYCGRPFVHIDVGPKRHWVWFCRGKGTRYARKARRGKNS